MTTNKSCGYCLMPLEDDEPHYCSARNTASSSIAELEAPTATACSGFINARGSIEHNADCSIHGALPVRGEWRCTSEDYDGDACNGDSFTVYGTAKVPREGYINVTYYGATDWRAEGYQADIFENDSYGDTGEAEDFEPEHVMCGECEAEYYPGDDLFMTAVEIYNRLA